MCAVLTIAGGGAGWPAFASSRVAIAGARPFSDCPGVYFLGARGTGETGPGSSGWDPKKDPYRGFGQTVYDVKAGLAAALGRGSVQAVPVTYDSNSVRTLLTSPKKYFADLAAGVSWTLKTLTGQAAKCGRQKIVLAGFSQGAMVMHRVLRKLQATAAGRAILARVVGVVLVGDGDQVPDDVGVTRYGSAPASAEGAGLAFMKGSGSSAAKFTASVGRRVLSVCTADDPVCDWKDSDICPPSAASCLLKWHHLIGIHLGYPKGILLAQAAERVVSDILGVGHWTAMTAPVPAGANATGSELSAIACTTSCVAIGGYGDQSGGFHPMLLTGSGTTWSAVAAPLPPDAFFPDLRMLACAAPTSCTVVGSYADDSGGGDGLLITRSGAAWSVTRAPVPKNAAPNPQVSLTGVTCPAVGDCVAIGHYANSAHETEGFVVTWSGSVWKATAIRPPSGSGPSELNSVACAGPTACVAVGEDDAAQGRAFLATGAGSSWRVMPAPLPKNASPSHASGLESETCPSAPTCVAAGWYLDSAGAGQVMLLTRSGTSWTAAEAPEPADGGQFYFVPDQVSCSTAAHCLVDTVYQGGTGDEFAAITGYGSSWATTTVALPPDAGQVALGDGTSYIRGAACASPSLCAIAGAYVDSSNTGEALLLAGSGSAWASMTATLPKGGIPGSNTLLSSIACPTKTTCAAVGQYSEANAQPHGMILTGPQPAG